MMRIGRKKFWVCLVLVKTFRQRFKLNIQLAAAVGTGQMLMAAGQPHGNEAV